MKRIYLMKHHENEFLFAFGKLCTCMTCMFINGTPYEKTFIVI